MKRHLAIYLMLLVALFTSNSRAQDDAVVQMERPTDEATRQAMGRELPVLGELERGTMPALDVALLPNRLEYRFGDDVTLNFETSRAARVWIFSIDDEGVTRQLLPNAYNRDNLIDGRDLYRIPSRAYALAAGPPDGRRRLIIAALDARAEPPYEVPERWDTRYPYPFVNDLDRRLFHLQRAARDFDWHQGVRITGDVNAAPPSTSYAEDRRTVFFRPPAGTFPQPGGWTDGNIPTPAPGKEHQYGRLSVTSSPTRAEVYLDGRYYGRTPLTVDVRADKYDMLIYRPGYQNYSTTMDVRRQRLSEISVRLTPIRR
jgi:hypothetical protein